MLTWSVTGLPRKPGNGWHKSELTTKALNDTPSTSQASLCLVVIIVLKTESHKRFLASVLYDISHGHDMMGEDLLILYKAILRRRIVFSSASFFLTMFSVLSPILSPMTERIQRFFCKSSATPQQHDAVDDPGGYEEIVPTIAQSEAVPPMDREANIIAPLYRYSTGGLSFGGR